jgi:hypothetical protein
VYKNYLKQKQIEWKETVALGLGLRTPGHRVSEYVGHIGETKAR